VRAGPSPVPRETHLQAPWFSQGHRLSSNRECVSFFPAHGKHENLVAFLVDLEENPEGSDPQLILGQRIGAQNFQMVGFSLGFPCQERADSAQDDPALSSGEPREVCTGIFREDDLASRSASLARRGTRGNFHTTLTMLL
jgi:hypothetical protein